MLLEHAADHDAKALRVLGRRILDVVAPEIGEAHEARVLEAEEQAARAGASFTMVEDGHGRCHGRFTIPALHGADAPQAPPRPRPQHRPAGSSRPGTGWGRRSASTSRPGPPPRSARPAGSAPPSWSP